MKLRSGPTCSCMLVCLVALLAGPGLAQNASVDPSELVSSPTPRFAGQRGLDWLVSNAVDWQKKHRCYGCHVQSVATMGAAVSKKNEFKVEVGQVDDLVGGMVREIDQLAPPRSGHHFAGAFHCGIAIGFYARYLGPKYVPDLTRLADAMVNRQQQDGSFEDGRVEPPIDQAGRIKSTASCLVTLIEADLTARNDSKYAEAIRKARQWLAPAKLETTQDHAYKILGLAWRREDEEAGRVKPVVDALKALQRPDGGFGEEPSLGSNAYATGLALYALKQGGVPVTDDSLVRGTLFLLKRQLSDGSWVLENSRSGRPSNFASTMYAVVGLGGVFDPRAEDEFLSLFRGRKKSPVNVPSVVLYLAFPIAVLGALRRIYR